MALDRQQFESALEACASEPIHQIGHVQAHGGLLAFTADAQLQILQASVNIADYLGADLANVLNQPLSTLFEAATLQQILSLIAVLDEQTTASGKITLICRSAPVNLLLHLYRSDQMLVMEMERDDGDQQEAQLAGLLLQTQQRMLRNEAYFETGKYFDFLVHLVRSFTGYDSVMAYRFDSHWNGEIIAQSRVEAAPSYMGMHFPASDIPPQARRLYTTNLVRVVANVDADPVPISPAINPQTGQPLDLTFSALRSLSPIHIEYLRNIGVRSSMVISLKQNGRLWGLIACHHLSPKPASMGMREAAIFLSRLVSTRLTTLEAMEHRRLTERANVITGDLLRALPLSSVREILLRLMPDLQNLLNASGMVVIVDGDLHVCGEAPAQDEIRQLLTWLAQNPRSEVVFSDFLANDCPDLAGAAATMAGILATPPSTDMRNCIIWLRKEKPRTINWAGKYEEGFVQNAAGNFRLTPRKSFELWSEFWSGRCAPWTAAEIGVATTLALAIPESLAQKRLLDDAQSELRQHRDHLEEMVRERTLALSIAKEAAESANRAKTAFLSKVSHELRTPMNGIMGMNSLALKRTDDPKLLGYLGKLGDASERLLSIINNMIDISEIEAERLTLNTGEFELSEVIERVRNLLLPAVNEKDLTLTINDIGNWRLLGDSERLGQVLLTLAANAIKFTPAGLVNIRARVTTDDKANALIRVEVQDSGIGIDKEARSRLFYAFEQADNSATRPYSGAGLGLAICKQLVKMMDGDIGVESTEGRGSTFWFTARLPLVANSTASQA